MPKFALVKPGDTLYDVHFERAGNTTIHRLGWWRVQVLSIDYENGTAMCSWNGNSPQFYTRHQIENLRRTIPKKLAHNGNVKP